MDTVILTSGSLGYNVTKELISDIRVIGLATDSRSLTIKGLAKERNIPLFEGNPRKGKLKEFLDQLDFSVDLILSINYLFLIERDVIDYPNICCLNIHGSLLPKYRGRTPHVWAIINNEYQAGITVHIIDEGCDTGSIVGQQYIEIPPEMTGAELLEQYENQYPRLISKVLDEVELDKLNPKPQDEKKATYFGIRTPQDGEINWDWQKQRIKNWVRAQANPYPGAFTFAGNTKIVVDSVEFTPYGFSYEMANGLVLSVDRYPLVKVSNGVLALTDIRNENELKFEILIDMVLGS